MSGITTPPAIGGAGGTIVVSDSTALALVDASELPLGTTVNNLDVGFPFKLTLSTAALDPDVVVEVKDTVGSRWILDTSSNDVESVTGTSPIEIDNTDPHNPVVELADDSVVFSVVAGDGITVDNTDPENPIVAADGGGTLAEIYTAGRAVDADNTMAGDYYNIFFDDNGTINSNQAAVGVPVGFDGFARRVLRWYASPTEVEIDRFVNQNDTQNTEGSIIHTYWNQLTAGPSARQYGASRWQMQNNPNHDLWYDPQRAGGGFLSQLNLSMLYAGDEAMHQNIHQFLSDGPHLQNIIPPASGGPYAIAGTHYNLFSSSNPANGTAVGMWSFKQGRINFFLDSYNSGTGRGNSHIDFWVTQDTTGVNELSAQFMAPSATQVSTADTFALKYDLTSDRAMISSNAGDYSKILTQADIAPGDATAVVSIPSAVINTKTATSVTVIATAAGRNFMPTGAYIRFTNVDTLTVGPTVELGNNGGEDNVAPVLAVANTVVTGSFVPFVMAAAPAIIDLTTTAVTAHFTVNSTATTADAIVYITGVYV
jgi:hypothetical protein